MSLQHLLDDIKKRKAGASVAERIESLLPKLKVAGIAIPLALLPIVGNTQDNNQPREQIKASYGMPKIEVRNGTCVLSKTQNPTPQRTGKALIVGHNHMRTEELKDALPGLSESAKIFAMELPENYTIPIQKYLNSQRKEADLVQLTNETIKKTELSPQCQETSRIRKEQTLSEITGTKMHVSPKDILKATEENFSQEPNKWTGTSREALRVMEKAHDCGMKVVCIDMNSVENWGTETLTQKVFEKRNAIMAGNLATLTKEGNVVAGVGAGHTGIGSGKSVEEMARKLGVSCESIDIATHMDPKAITGEPVWLRDIERNLPADHQATLPQQIGKTMRTMITPPNMDDDGPDIN